MSSELNDRAEAEKLVREWNDDPEGKPLDTWDAALVDRITSLLTKARAEQREADAEACRQQQRNAIRLRDSLQAGDENEKAAAKEIDLGQHYLGEMADRILSGEPVERRE